VEIGLLFIGLLLIWSGLTKEDVNSKMRFIHYKPIRNYGKGYSIALGIFCLILGLLLFTAK